MNKQESMTRKCMGKCDEVWGVWWLFQKDPVKFETLNCCVPDSTRAV